jgi:hypothetical protein
MLVLLLYYFCYHYRCNTGHVNDSREMSGRIDVRTALIEDPVNTVRTPPSVLSKHAMLVPVLIDDTIGEQSYGEGMPLRRPPTEAEYLREGITDTAESNKVTSFHSYFADVLADVDPG